MMSAKSIHEHPRATTASGHRLPVYRRLSHEEETHFAGLIANGDIGAQNNLVQANLPLVIKIARDFQGRGLHLDDLIGEGNLGLIRAAKDFQPGFGTRFSTYAGHWIKQTIRHALINTTSTIRLPAHMVGMLTKWRRAQQGLTREKGRTPRFEEVASVLGLSEVQKELVSKANRTQSFKHESEAVLTTERTWRYVRNTSPACEATLVADDERLLLSQRLERLDDRERAILEFRYGLDGSEPLTLREIGCRLGITREWVRKIEIRAIRKLGDDQSSSEAGLKVRTRIPAKRQAAESTAI